MKILRVRRQDWARQVAEAFLERVQANPKLRVCLPSGDTPVAVYAEIASLAREKKVSLARVQVFLLDEYGGLDPDDPGRGAAMLEREFLSKLEERPAQVRLIDTESASLRAEIAALEREIGTGFDLTLLGIGLNGHLGMNEPSSAADAGVRRVDLHPASRQSSHGYGVRKTPTWGVTLGMRQLLGSNEVWLLATGAKKAQIVRQALEGPLTPDNPASLLQPHPNCTVFLDEDAAALLARDEPP